MSKNNLLDANTYYTTAMIVFAFAFVLHGSRVMNSWDMFLGSWLVPMWVSYLAVVVTAVLAYQSLQMRK
jgi:hypothetical protein